MNKSRARSVLVQDGNIEKALRKFKKKVQNSGILNDLREREFYIKPTTERKLRRSAAKNRWRKQLEAQQLQKLQTKLLQLELDLHSPKRLKLLQTW